MNETQEMKIKELRNHGVGYKRIANQLNLSVDAVKYFCRKNNLTGTSAPMFVATPTCCKECGKPLKQKIGMKAIKFCSITCRKAWWNKNRDQLQIKNGEVITCPSCGKRFKAYKQEHRKFCSHQCYIAFRFGRGDCYE
ncbi:MULTISPECIES: hypothetical protein [Enterococcus]|uniref:hypothetical protein n=1 Tax=Enterococcus TaxID=1350 RepID=UPI001BCB3785|nr:MULTISPECIES: hypothetical protein [Enterococcus]MDT2804862.1 hypothetical protein [Enterococcus lactis]